MIIRAPRDSADLTHLHSLLEKYDIAAFFRAEPASVIAELVSRVRSRTLQAMMAFDPDGTPVGFLLFYFNHLQLECDFCDMFISEAYRGGNIGPELVRTVKDIAIASGLTHGRFYTDSYNPKVWQRLVGGVVTEIKSFIWRM